MIKEKEKKDLYRFFTASFPFGTHPMNTIAQALTDNKIRSKDYGYSKLRSLIQDCPEFMEMVDDPKDPTIPSVRFYSWRDLQTQDPKPKIKPKAKEKSELSPREEPKAPAMIIKPAPKPMGAIRQAQSGDVEACTVNSLPDSLIRNARLDPKLLNLLSMKSNRAIESVPAMIEAGFQQAKAVGDIYCSASRISFQLDQLASNGKPLVLTFKHVTQDGHRHFILQYIDDSGVSTPRGAANIPNSSNPSQALERFAFLGSWQTFLQDLADMALEEQWDFTTSDQKNHYILKKYIQYTFHRLQLENKVSISMDRRLAAFNTGLVDPFYDYIYACFVPNQHGSSPWLFKEFALAGSSGLGKQLVNRFNPLPQAASYFNRKEDLLYDLEKDLHIDYDHILLENLNRFSESFLGQQFYDDPHAQHLLGQITQRQEKNRDTSAAVDDLRHYLSKSLFLYNRLKNRLDDAIEVAKKQVRWNFNVAIPSYYPSRNSMNLMLPLQLSCRGVVDNVLVVELTPAGNYQGQTLLTLEQAYIDARLICYPGTSWLSPDRIRNSVCTFDASADL